MVKLDTNDLTKDFSRKDIELVLDDFFAAVGVVKEHFDVSEIENAHIGFYAGGANNFCGVEGSAPGPDRINFFFHPWDFHPSDPEHRLWFSSIVVHELHHLKRWHGPGVGHTLGEWMIAEGLAMKFQQEAGYPLLFDVWARHDENANHTAERAKLHLNDEPVRGRFLDSEGKLIDHYVLGSAVTNGWLALTGKTAAQAHDVPADIIIKSWLAGELELTKDRASEFGYPEKSRLLQRRANFIQTSCEA